MEPRQLQLAGVIGFGGRVVNGLKWHPGGEYIVFPLGTTVVVKNTRTNAQAFLQGHTDKVTCVALSECGRYIASGQRAQPGVKVRLLVCMYVWALAEASAVALRPVCVCLFHALQ